jgi:hypothetical protein
MTKRLSSIDLLEIPGAKRVALPSRRPEGLISAMPNMTPTSRVASADLLDLRGPIIGIPPPVINTKITPARVEPFPTFHVVHRWCAFARYADASSKMGLQGVFFFDMASTPDADKIVTAIKRLIDAEDPLVNIALQCMVNGDHPSDVVDRYVSGSATAESDNIEGCDGVMHLLVRDEDEMDEAYESRLNCIDDLMHDVKNVGKWEYCDDGTGEFDRACVRLIRFYPYT